MSELPRQQRREQPTYSSTTPNAETLALGFSYANGVVYIVCKDRRCPCGRSRIMTTATGTYLDLTILDRAITAHINYMIGENNA